MSAASSGVFRRRTPQLMSNPIAPGLITPRSASVATTPPTGRPYPWWMSGIASAALTIPGRVAPLAICSGEATDRVEADVAEEERAGAAGESRAEPGDEKPEHHEVPDRLVEEGRVEVLVLAVAELAVRRRDVELPRQVRRTAVGLLVEEVPPAPDRLAERDRGRRHVEAAQDRKPPAVREPRADERAQDQPAVDREAAFPDRDDLPRIPAVVVPVERDLVEPRPHEAREDRPLTAADDVIGRQALAFGLTVAEPEAGDDRRRHQNPVPADDDGTELERDRTGRADHGFSG